VFGRWEPSDVGGGEAVGLDGQDRGPDLQHCSLDDVGWNVLDIISAWFGLKGWRGYLLHRTRITSAVSGRDGAVAAPPLYGVLLRRR